MIISKTVITKWNPTTRLYYEQKGYVFTKYKDDFEVKVEDLKDTSAVIIKVKCDYCGEEKELRYLDYIKSINDETHKYACSKCVALKKAELYADKRNEHLQDLYNELIDNMLQRGYTPICDFKDFHTCESKVRYICPKHGEKETSYHLLVKNHSGCRECGNDLIGQRLRRSIEEVKEIIESKNNNILLNPEDYINTTTKNLRVICGSCGKEHTVSLSSIIHSNGMCQSCGYQYEGEQLKLTPEEVYNRFKANGNELLNPEEYVRAGLTNLKVRCSCGNIYTTSLANYQTRNVVVCPTCSQKESSGERKVRSILEKYNIDYIPEYKYDDCVDKRRLPFDFYCCDSSKIIEFDGEQHYNPIYGEETFEMTVRHDKIKTEYCKTHNIPLLRIPYFEASNMEETIKKFLGI